MESTRAFISKASKRPKINIILPKQLFVDLTQDNTKTPSPKLQLSSPSAPNAPSKTPSTKDTSSSSIDYTPKSPTLSSSPFTNGYLNPPLSPPPRVSPSPPTQATQENASMDITLTLSPITPLDVNSEADLVDVITIGIPSLMVDDFTKETIRVEYECRPLRCDECKIFGHVHDNCLKKVKRKSKLKSTNGGQFVGPSVKQTFRYEPKANTSAPKKRAANVSNPSKSSSMLKTANTSSKKDNFTMSNSFSALNDEEVENVYDESANLYPHTKTGGSSSFTAAAG
nr:hypothetical protein [Tanacetum cinerariifolium]